MNNILGKRIRILREEKDLQQKKLADDLGISRYQLSRYEGGQSNPDPELIARISNYFNVTTDYLLGKTNKPELTEEEDFDAFKENPSLERWYRELPKNKEEDLRRLKKIWEAFKEEHE